MQSGPRAGERHTSLVGTIDSMESLGTASFPGHDFYLTPTYDRAHVLKRWTITEDDPVLYYDPLDDLSHAEQDEEIKKWVKSGKWTEKTEFDRDAWIVDKSFGRDYLVKTQSVWLSHFPQPYLDSNVDDIRRVDDKSSDDAMEEMHGMHMWQASYIGQKHKLDTSNLYYTSLPTTMDRLTKDDYEPGAEEQRHLEMKQYQSTTPIADNRNAEKDTTMPLALNVVSVTPRVFESKKFLSLVEVQHLIDLASGKKGDVIMESSTVSASNINGGGSNDAGKRKVRGSKDNARSSTGGWIHREQDAIVDTIFRRIADLLNVDESLMRDKSRGNYAEGDADNLPTHDRIVEAMQLIRYGPGEEYTAHHDFTYPSIGNRYQPKRYATVLLHLTGEGDIIDESGVRRSSKNSEEDGLKGGATTFPRAITTDLHDGVKVAPQSGKAIVFYNVLPDGNMDDLSQHSGDRVESGVKYAANVWVWDPIVN